MSHPQVQFLLLVEDLVERVRAWAEPSDWVTKAYSKRMRAPDRSIFEVSALYLKKGPARVLLDPIAYDFPGAEAAVDLYLMPTYEDLARLFYREGRWPIHYAFSKDPLSASLEEIEVLSLDEPSLIRVLDSIAAYATPSV